MVLGFTGPTSQTMRQRTSLVALGFSSQGRLIWSVTLTSMSSSDVEPPMPFASFLYFQRIKRVKESRLSPSRASRPSF